MSIAGGMHRAFDHINKVGGEALQIFTANQRQWHSPSLGAEQIQQFREKWGQSPQMPVASHASYLINLATGQPELSAKTLQAFVEELNRCEQLAIPWLIVHPGSHGGDGIETALQRVVKHIDEALSQVGPSSRVVILLETTAGQGTGVGSRFEELGWILTNSRYPQRLGVCLDTCHIFAAGYDIRSKQAYEQTFAHFDQVIGCHRLQFFHINDSKKELGSRVDRHEHIGQGRIGLAGFRNLLNDPRFREHPMTLETPKGAALLEDKENLSILRSLYED